MPTRAATCIHDATFYLVTVTLALWPRCGSTTEPPMLPVAESAVSAAGIGDLKTLPLSPGARELRIWPGSAAGMLLPSSMLQIRIDPHGAATGTLWLYYTNDVEWESRKEKRKFEQAFRSQCVAVFTSKETTTCVAKVRKDIDWSALHTKLDQLDVWSIPDQSELPLGPDPVIDGLWIVIETRTSAGYRRYNYTNPGWREHPTAQKVAQIATIAAEISPSKE